MVPVSFEFSFCGEEFRLTRSLALFWPRENALLVADLHLEKGSFFAQSGQLLPPYDSRETLEKLAQALADTGATRVFTLGDNFHDAGGPGRMDADTTALLKQVASHVDWVWITGNHDHAHYIPKHRIAENRLSPADLCGTQTDEIVVNGIVLRHQAEPGETRPELSGHYHPRFQTRVRGRNLRKACAVISQHKDGHGRMILPAFGAFTGGMDAADPVILKALQPADSINALLPTASKLVQMPLWRKPV